MRQAPDRIDRGLVMSSPVHDDGDKRTMYIPPWVRDDQRDGAETRRLQAEIVAAAERLKPPSPPEPQPQRPPPQMQVPQPQQQRPLAMPEARFQTRFKGDRLAANQHEGFDIENGILAAWEPSMLDPVPMPPPPKPKLGGPTWGMVTRLAGASGFAAVVALFVTGVFPLPSIGISLSRNQADAARPEPVAPPTQATQAAVAPAAALAAVPPQTVGVAPVVLPPPPAPARPRFGEPEPPKAHPAAVPEPRALDYMSREEIEALLKRGQDLIATGDISGGRLLLTRAAEAGDARASFALASTYDAAVIAGLGVVGTFPDPVKARAWYTKAAGQGSAEAAQRLEQPHLRQR